MLRKALKWGNSQLFKKNNLHNQIFRRFNLIQERANKKQEDQFRNEMNTMVGKTTYTLKDYKQKVYIFIHISFISSKFKSLFNNFLKKRVVIYI